VVGHILVLLYDTNRKIEKGEIEEALVSLEKIESVFCGPGCSEAAR
jgi:hypothetical protein